MYEELIKDLRENHDKYFARDMEAADAIEELTDNHVGKWIRFITRPLTEEEKEEHPEWDYIIDCKLPDDGQDILVSNGRWVTVDTFFSDDGCYLDSNDDLEGLWWMPLPEPPKLTEEE